MKYLILLCVFISACSMQNHENLGAIAVQEFTCIHDSDCNAKIKMDCSTEAYILKVIPSKTIWYSCK